MALQLPSVLRSVNGKGFVSFSPGVENSSVLVSFKSNAFNYKLSEDVVEKSWFLPSYLSLTSPIMYQPTEGLYIAVINHNRLLVWNGVEEKLEKVPYKDLSYKIFSLTLHESMVYLTTFCGDVQSALYAFNSDYSEESKIPSNGNILSTSMATSGNRTISVHLIDKEDIKSVYIFKIQEDGEILTKKNCVKLKHWDLSKNFISHCFCSSSESFPLVLITLSSESILSKIVLSESEEPVIEDSSISLNHLRLDSGNTSMTPLQGSHFGVCGPNVAGEGSSLSLINVKFMILLSTIQIKMNTSPVTSFGSEQFFVKQGSSVIKIGIKNLPSNLADVIRLNASSVSDHSSAEGIYDVLPPILKEKNLNLLLNFLEKYNTDIPELLLLAILEVFVIESGSFESPEMYWESMRSALTMPVTESLLLPLLRKTEFSIVKEILEFLDIGLKLETDPEIVNKYCKWISMVVNAQYLNFQLSDDSLEIIEALKETVDSIDCTRSIYFTTLPLIDLINENKICKNITGDNDFYSIELIEL